MALSGFILILKNEFCLCVLETGVFSYHSIKITFFLIMLALTKSIFFTNYQFDNIINNILLVFSPESKKIKRAKVS